MSLFSSVEVTEGSLEASLALRRGAAGPEAAAEFFLVRGGMLLAVLLSSRRRDNVWPKV